MRSNEDAMRDRAWSDMRPQGPEAEVILRWIEGVIETKRTVMGGAKVTIRKHFTPLELDGAVVETSAIADAMTNMILEYGILTEAIMLLAESDRDSS